MKHLSEDDLILLHYGESKSAKWEAHLRECETCRTNLQKMSQVLKAIQPASLPNRDELYGSMVWNRIRAELPERRAGWREQLSAWWRQPRAWAAMGAVATLVVAAFLAGRFWGPGQPGSPPIANNIATPAPEKIKERVLLVAVGSHLERSQMVLIELANAPSSGSLDISAEQRRAGELLSANRLYRQTATEAGDAKVAAVLEQLERVLMQIAHGPAKLTKTDIDSMRRQIESQGLVFKIRVVESNVRNELRKKTPERGAPAGIPSRKTT
jgi:hypothetical protein